MTTKTTAKSTAVSASYRDLTAESYRTPRMHHDMPDGCKNVLSNY
jgi:hypothetical protein